MYHAVLLFVNESASSVIWRNTDESGIIESGFRAIADAVMEFNKISVVFSVGTAFMPSGDSSPCTSMKTGITCIDTVHGDESPDAINRVPTLLEGIKWWLTEQ